MSASPRGWCALSYIPKKRQLATDFRKLSGLGFTNRQKPTKQPEKGLFVDFLMFTIFSIYFKPVF
ncbi:MAG: hypothetical protein BM557_01310 [Flavobacterium sp. MedPE-SWcel]|nr:MAG: hypothetical protein BM557_01310 [Flavobacterium sp. MedPE-SWcel]